jgi:hypothetical protein
MRELSLNFVAILVATVAKMALGALWYSNVLFFKPWIRMSGTSEAQVRQGLGKALVVDLIGSFLMAFVLAHTIKWSDATTVPQGLMVACLNWFGFVAVATISSVTYERKPFALFALNSGYLLVSMLIMGAILAVWS